MQSMVEPINLVVLTSSPEPASRTVDIMRNNGRLAYSTQFASTKQFESAIKSTPYEVVLIYPDFPESIKEVQKLLNHHAAYTLPIISVIGDLDEASVSMQLQQGAFTTALKSNTGLIAHAIDIAVSYSRANRSVHYLTQKLNKLEDQNNQILKNSEDGIAFIIDGLHAYANETYLDFFGFSDFSELAITSLLDILIIEDATTFKNQLRDLQKEKLQELEFESRPVNDDNLILSVVMKPAVHEEEPCVQIVVEELKKTQPVIETQIPELNFEARIEDEEDIIPRHEFLEHIEKQSALSDSEFAPFSIISLSINRYENHKKRLGIKNTETLLLAKGEKILEHLANNDKSSLLCRFSDSGYTIYSDKHNESDVEALCKSIQDTISNNVFDINDNTISITTSAAYGSINKDARNVQELLGSILQETSNDNSDKQDNTLVQIDAKNDNLDEAGNKMLAHIKDNLESGFSSHYQPIIQLQGSSLPCYEVFIRMKNKKNGEFIMPGDFLPVAAAANLSTQIDNRVIIQACKTIKNSNYDHLMLMIQLNAESLKAPNLLPIIHGAMKKYQVPKGSLTFVLREKDAANHLKLTHKLFKGLNTLGCLTAIKQYGSSKNTDLIKKNLKFKFALLDGSLTQSLETKEDHVELLTNHVNTLHQSKVKVIAPFIESAASLPYLWQTGVDLIQGDYIQTPSENMNYNFNA